MRWFSLSLLLLLACGGSTPDPVVPPPDSGVPDAGVGDSGTPDAGAPDAGGPDAGVPDSGTPDAGALATLSVSVASSCVAGGGTLAVTVIASPSLHDPLTVSAFGRSATCTGGPVLFQCAFNTSATDPAGPFAISATSAGATPGSANATLGTTIANLRTHWVEGEQVTVCEATVSAVRRDATSTVDQAMYVSDPAGGANGGIELFRSKASTQRLPSLYDHLRIDAWAMTYAGHRELSAPAGQDLGLTLLSTSFVPPPELTHPSADVVKDPANHAADEALGSMVELSDAPVTMQSATPPELAFVQSDGGTRYDGVEAGGVLVDLYPYTKECMPDGGYPSGASFRPLRGIYDYVGLPDGGGYHTLSPVRCGDIGWPTPIQYVVVLVKENHSFENYFTGFPGATYSTTATLSDGGVISRPVAPSGGLPRDVSHSHYAAVTAWADGGMTGFDDVYNAEPDGGAPDYLPFSYYTESQIPAYWAYARNFVLFDNFRSTLLGPTMPGHFATVTGQTPFLANSTCSGSSCSNPGNGCSAPAGTTVPTFDQNLSTCSTGTAYPCFNVPSVVDALPTGLTWMAYSYGSDTTSYSPFNLVQSIGTNAAVRSAHLRDQQYLLSDLTSGNQANLIVASITTPGDLSEHPPDDPCLGQNYTVQLMNAIMQGPHWNQTAIVITWDDYGGFYDSVAPPVERCASGAVYQPGFRLPAIVVSPFAKQGAVVHDATEQASVPRLVEELFNMPFMSKRDPHARDGRSGSLLGAFDFTQAPRAPVILQPMSCP